VYSRSWIPFVFLVLLALAVSAFGQCGQTTITDPAEFNAYQLAMTQADPATKAAAIENFLAAYPGSQVKISALESLVKSYAALNSKEKALDAARRLVQADPTSLLGLGFVVWAENTLANGDREMLSDAASTAQTALNAQKPACMTDAEFQAIRNAFIPSLNYAVAHDPAKQVPVEQIIHQMVSDSRNTLGIGDSLFALRFGSINDAQLVWKEMVGTTADLYGKVISASSTSLTVDPFGHGDEVPVTVKLTSPLPDAPSQGAQVNFSGMFDSFTDSPRAVVMRNGKLDAPQTKVAWTKRAETVDLAELGARAGGGEVKAQVELGSRYAVGKDVTKNYAQSLSWLQKAAVRGNAEAEYDLGMMYYHGLGVKANYTRAAGYFQKAAAQNYSGASAALQKAQYAQAHGIAAVQPTHQPMLRRTGSEPVSVPEQTFVAFSFSSPGVDDFGGDGAWGAALNRNEQTAIDQAVNTCAGSSQRPDWCETDGRWPVCQADGQPKWVALAINNDGTRQNWADGEAIGYETQSDAAQWAVSNCNHTGCHVVWSQAVGCGAPVERGSCAAIETGESNISGARLSFGLSSGALSEDEAIAQAHDQLTAHGGIDPMYPARNNFVYHRCGSHGAFAVVDGVDPPGDIYWYSWGEGDTVESAVQKAMANCTESSNHKDLPCRIVSSW